MIKDQPRWTASYPSVSKVETKGIKMRKQAISRNGLVADLFTNGPAEPQKAVIMLGGSEGGNSWSRIRRPIEILVEKGFQVLTLAYFKAQGLPNYLQEIPLEYFEKAFEWLSAQEGIMPDKFAIIGGSKGAEAALVLASKYPQVKAVVAFSPSCFVWQGIPAKRFALGEDVRSSWSSKGEGLPFIAYPPAVKKTDLLLLRLRKMHQEAIDQNKVDGAVIPVEKIQGSILLISGEQDRMWPATQMSNRIIERLRANNFEYGFEHIAHDTGHNGIIMNRDCWRKTFAFLDEHFA